MKGFLLDENLPARLLFSPSLPIIPRSRMPAHPSDSQIWEFACQHQLVIVSKDADFPIASSRKPRLHGWFMFDSVICEERNFTLYLPAYGRKLKPSSKPTNL